MSLLEIIPSYKQKCYYLDKSKQCQIIVYRSKELDNETYFDTLNRCQNMGKTDIIMKNKTHPAHRTYISLGKYPDHNLDVNKSYMYDNIFINNKKYTFDTIPITKNILKCLHTTIDYNQATINWYDNGNDYIPFHKDCEIGMTNNKPITIVSFQDKKTPFDNLRNIEFKLAYKDKVDIDDFNYTNISIKCLNGTVVTFNRDTNHYFRHGVRKINSNSPRISVSFRCIDNDIQYSK